MQSSYYWSSASDVGYTEFNALVVGMGSGGVYYGIKMHYTSYVWPVRKGR